MNDLSAIPFLDDEVPRLPPGEGDYEELRRRYGVEVPGRLRALLAVRNGGEVRRLWVNSRNAALEKGLHVSRFLFLKLDDFSHEGMVGCFRGWRNEMGAQGLPFAADEAGNVFFVDLSADPALVLYALQGQDIRVYAVSPDLDTFLAELHEGAEARPEQGLRLYNGEVKRKKEVPAGSRPVRKRGCCSARVFLAGALLFLLLYLWLSSPAWSDGAVRVYGENGEYTLMVRGDGYSMELLDAQVVEAGSDARWLVVRQWRDDTNYFYAIKKPWGVLSHFDFEHPLSKEGFERLKAKENLPPFTWRNRWVDYPR